MPGADDYDQPAIALAGLEILLDECMKLRQGDELLVIYDEQFQPYHGALTTATQRRGLATTSIFLSRQEQLQMVARAILSATPGSVVLPKVMREALLSATAILNVLNGDQETSVVRGTIVDSPRAHDSRLAHIPGIDGAVLNVLKVSPIGAIYSLAELFAWALGEGRSVQLSTQTRDGAPHALHLELDGWDNEPMMSPGVIVPGSWGNVPPGETFCCPEPSSIHGTVCINGSLPGRRLGAREEVVLSFEDGRLVEWKGADTCEAYFKSEQERASLRRDHNWNMFAELGIGLNPAIKELTGNSLYDEKAYGTVHVAIGANDIFGHPIVAGIHADMVTSRPSMVIDGRTVIEGGELLASEIAQWRESRAVPISSFAPGVRVFLRHGLVSFEADGIKRVLSKAHRIGHVSIAHGGDQEALSQAAECLRNYGDVRVSEFLESHPTFSGVDSRAILSILDHYRMLGFANL